MTEKPRHLGLHHVAIRVPEMTVARHFYVDLLGYRVEWEPDAESLYLTHHGDNLALHRGEVSADKQRLDHIGILVENAEEVFAWEQYLKAHGVKIAQAAKTHRDGATSCYVYDPADNLVQFIHHPPISPALAGMARSEHD